MISRAGGTNMSLVRAHFKEIETGTNLCYAVAKEARAKGFDPARDVETPVATTLAEKAVGLVSVIYPQINDKKIIDRILDLEKEYGQLDPAVAFKIAEEIAKEKYCKFTSLLEAMDGGIRVGFSYITLGVVSSPLEGFTGLKVAKTRDGKDYLKAYFSGPIRSAGTTAACLVLMLIDYLRENFGFAKFDPDENEVRRYVTENYDYHERVNNLQYLPTEAEIEFLASKLPIQIDGEPSETREVSNYKDLDRIETNAIRGGMCLIFSEGLAQKAQKGVRLLKKGIKERGMQSTGWDYLDEFIEKFKMKKKSSEKTDATPVYIKDIVAGRPVFSHPSRSGGFRFRYGRSRTGGFSATLVHPATMGISNSFISNGTQLKIEKPTKGCAVTVCDFIDGPIVKLKNGGVRKLYTFEEAKNIYKDTEEILYFGDILFPLDDVVNRNYDLIKPGYVEEWWVLELAKAGGKVSDHFQVELAEATQLSQRFTIPLHPEHIFYWTQITREQFFGLIDWLGHAEFVEGKLILPWARSDRERFTSGKRAFELIGLEHDVAVEHVVVPEKRARALLVNLGFDMSILARESFNSLFDALLSRVQQHSFEKTLEYVNALCSFKIKDKAGAFIGARMGRPEKAKLRKLTGSPHVLFPVGDEGGRLRSFQAACDGGIVTADLPYFRCTACGKETIYGKCESCGGDCVRVQTEGREHGEQKIDIRAYFEHAKKIAGVSADEVPLIKGVRGTSNADHVTEFLAKGFLRAKHNLHVNKDGTIRYDMTEMSVTHFKPREVGTSVEKLVSLGYKNDIYGKQLTEDDQILELYPHDVILPACPESPDERADDVFFRIMRFIDDELVRIYGLAPFYNVQTKEDVVGHLVVCIAPHICTASVGRIVGFSKVQVLLASPYMHAAMRRDCDGDEAASMLLMDLLLNFSKKFLPAHRGGTQDSPLVLNIHIHAGEVDDQILDFVLGKYNLELYELAEQGKHSSEVKMDTVKTRLAQGKDTFTNINYTHECTDFNAGVINSSYKSLPTMQEKVDAQMDLCKKLRAVDTSDVARLIIERHFVRDTRGNLRKFSMQGFRCVGCNEKFRRPPLTGKCTKCGGKIIFTISEGSILKYMQPSLELARTYGTSPYLLESLELTEMYIQSIFGKEKEKQEALGKWF